MPKAIQDNNWLYNVLSPLVQYGTRCHYQSFDIRGTEKLPTDGAYIIAPCHQQALMEPLAILNFAPKPPVFLARADIFAKPTVRKILTFLKILPVYRIRDGKDNLSKNTDIFEKSRDVLLDGFPLCLMAEGRHNDRHHLLPLVKGMFRIAGETQLRLGEHPLYIVPTGIDFDEYERPYANLVVNIGEPIPVKPFMETFQNNEPVALNQMRNALASALMNQMHDIRDEEHYDEIMTLCSVLNAPLRKKKGLKNNAWNRFLVRQMISREADKKSDKRDNIIAATGKLNELCNKMKVTPRMIANRWSLPATVAATAAMLLALAAIVLLPTLRLTALFWLLCFPVIVMPTHRLVRKIIEDTQFRSSINFGLRFLFSILYAIVIAIVTACTGGLWMNDVAALGGWWALVAIGLAFIGARLEAPLTNSIKAILNNCRWWWLKMVKGKKIKELEKLLSEITAAVAG